MENFEESERKFTPRQDLAKLFIGIAAANYLLIGSYLYAAGVLETKSFNPLPIIRNYQELSRENLMKIKMQNKGAGNLENSISIRDFYKAD